MQSKGKLVGLIFAIFFDKLAIRAFLGKPIGPNDRHCFGRIVQILGQSSKSSRFMASLSQETRYALGRINGVMLTDDLDGREPLFYVFYASSIKLLK
jgi:hypothetical protein